MDSAWQMIRMTDLRIYTFLSSSLAINYNKSNIRHFDSMKVVKA